MWCGRLTCLFGIHVQELQARRPHHKSRDSTRAFCYHLAMAHLHRFFVPSTTPGEGLVELPSDEAHHAARVVRVREGDRVELFDGVGRLWNVEVESVTKREVRVRIRAAQQAEPPARPLALLQAWPNHEKTVEAIVRRGVELGVTSFIFFRGGHSERAPRQSEKWVRLAIETCKQCRRNWLPAFHVALDLTAALETARGTVLLATTERPPTPIATIAHEESVALLVGPEGDFTPQELDLALERGALPIGLGDVVLRSEIAAMVAMVMVQYERGLLGPKPGPA